MAYFSLHAYDADVWVPEFKGLNQADVNMNPDTRYAWEEENVETPNGVLQPQAACTTMLGSFTSRVETLISFHRRWYEGSGSHEWYVCCAGGKIYNRQADSTDQWVEVKLPTGITKYSKSTWSHVTYEINTEDTTVDVILMSNDQDGMIMVVPPDKPTSYIDLSEFTHTALHAKTHDELHSEKWTIRTIDTNNLKFGVIERYDERIWGGAVAGNPDMLVYSRPYDPTDWTPPGVGEEPEDGSGDILQPSWDGDKFYALKRFGDQLLAFKKNKIWRVVGVSPGQYQFQEQYGGGTQYFNTIAVDKERVLMGSNDGLNVYDGMSISHYAWEQIEKVWQTVNKAALDQMCAALYKERYYLAFPADGSSTNNAMLVYNFQDKTILFYKDFHVESFLPTDDELFITSSTLPGRILSLKYDSWTEGVARDAKTRWVSPWMDFGYKRIQKGGFDFYFTPEVQNESVTFSISMQTEKKIKTKQYTVDPIGNTWGHIKQLTWMQAKQKTWYSIRYETSKFHRSKRLHFSGTGRRFRLIIETPEGNTAPWRLVGGLQLVVETDPD